MKRRQKRGGIIEYLSACGALDSNDANAIADAKKLYRNEYKKKWRENYFKTHATFLVGLNEQQLRIIQKAAARHRRSITKYLQLASLKYSQQEYLVCDVAELREVKMLLLQTCLALQSMVKNSSTQFFELKELADWFERIEGRLVGMLVNPPLLETKVASLLRSNPDYRNILVELLNQ